MIGVNESSILPVESKLRESYLQNTTLDGAAHLCLVKLFFFRQRLSDAAAKHGKQ